MIALISPAKTMLPCKPQAPQRGATEPRFAEQSQYIVSNLLQYSSAELSQIFKVSAPIALALRARLIDFTDSEKSPCAAIDSYDGVVYKHFKDGSSFSEEQLSYLQQHLRISSLLYGLLRPLDKIKPYRMEGFIRLSDSDERVDKYWRDIQTQTLISDVQNAGGSLLYLASAEEKNAFHWREVQKSIRVIDFQFLQHKGDKLRQVIVYTKMARGEMIRYMTENQITDPEELKSFEWAGYRFHPELSTPDKWVWIMD